MTGWSSSEDDDGGARERSAEARGAESDAALIRAVAAARDRAAFLELFRRYGARVKGYMLRCGASPELAEEAAQETLLAIWRRAETFDPARASAAAWIFTIARNKRVDLLRQTPKALPEEEPALSPEPPEAPERVVAAEDRDAQVRAALAALSAEQRQVVLLAFYQGYAHSEIAEQLSLPIGTVKSRLRLAFAKLRDALGVEFRDELLDF